MHTATPADEPALAGASEVAATGASSWVAGGRALVSRLLDERVVFGCFVTLILIGALRHEPWRDEWQAWLIARDSRSLGEVLTNSRYEGHPPLWHLVLWFASRVSRDIMVMQLVNATIAIVTAAVVLWRAPFPKAVRAALVFGYFPLYEYGTIARSYALALMLLLLVCVEVSRSPRRPVLIGLAIGLMMLTSAHALLVAVAVGAAVLVDEVLARRRTGRSLRPTFGLAAGVVAALAAGAWAVAQITPPADGGYGVGLSTPSDARSAVPPLDHVAVAAFIGRREAPSGALLHAVAFGVGLMIVLLIAWRVRFRPAALTLWLAGMGLLLGLAWLRYVGTIRHMGYLYMVGLATLWLERRFVGVGPTGIPARRLVNRAFVVLVVAVLGAHVVFGARAMTKDLLRPYSPTPAAAAWISSHGLADAQLIGNPDEVAIAVGGHLDRPMLFLEQGRLGTFVLWRNDRRHVSDHEIVEAAERLLGGDDRPVVVITRDLLTGPLGPLELAASFTDGIVWGEPIHLYVGTGGG